MLQARGIVIHIDEAKLGDGGTWRVARSAKFAERADAVRLATRLNQEFGIEPLVVRAPPVSGGS